MQECIVPLVVSRQDIVLFDCTWIVVESNSLVSLINASARHQLREILITRVMTAGEKIAIRKNLQHLKGRCQPKEARVTFVKYVINPNYNTQPAFIKTVADLILKYKRDPGSTKLWIIARDEQPLFVPKQVERAAIHVSGVKVTNIAPTVSMAKRTKYYMNWQVLDFFREVDQRGAARALPNARNMVELARLTPEEPHSVVRPKGLDKSPFMTCEDALKLVILYALYPDDKQFDKWLERDATDKAKSYLKKVKNDPAKGPLRDLGRGWCVLDQPCVDKLLRPIFAEFPDFITLSLVTFLGGVDFDVLLNFLREKPKITRMVIDPKQFDENDQVKLQEVMRAIGRNIEVKGPAPAFWHNPFENPAKSGAKGKEIHVQDKLTYLLLHCYLPDGYVDKKQLEKYESITRSEAKTYLRLVNNKPYEGPMKDHGKGCIFDKQCVESILQKVYETHPDFTVLSLASFTGGVDFDLLADFLKANRLISRIIYEKGQFNEIELQKLKKIIAVLKDRKLLPKATSYFTENPFMYE
ncbi:MAG: hypothetical protein LLG04_10925 [Parachlamydia sp.]|nr:hypothetical protein [Parachlamydia sp.]